MNPFTGIEELLSIENLYSKRLVTRSDFDGLVCAMLFRETKLILPEQIVFVHPKDMQDKKIALTSRDITTNLPYVDDVFLCFDHHSSEEHRMNKKKRKNYVYDATAPSTARMVYNFFGGDAYFKPVFKDILNAVDKADSARFTMEDVTNPQDWTLLNLIMDARTGLGRFRNFRISNYELMCLLIEACRDMSIQDVLRLPDVQERTSLFFEHRDKAYQQIQSVAYVPVEAPNVIVLDLRKEVPIWCVSRFQIYTLFPEQNVSMTIIPGRYSQNTVFALGKSIFNRSCNVDLGKLALTFGGGGHMTAGTCQVENEDASKILKVLLEKLKQ